jgi:putative membrane protein
MAEETKKILVVVVDRDDDLGEKTGLRGPVIGRQNNLDAAVKLALSDPEDADANAIFYAVKVHDDLLSRGDGIEAEVATLTGSRNEGITADMNIFNQLREVLERFPAQGCIFVSDGATDALVTPIISSQVGIISVQRVTVRQSQTVEQSWLILGKYLRLGLTDPRYAKFLLGIPGGFIALAATLSLVGLAQPMILVLALGIVLLFWGFRIDIHMSKLFSGFYRISQMPAIGQIRAFAYMSAAASLLVGLYLGVTSAYSTAVSLNLSTAELSDLSILLPAAMRVAGAFITSSIDLVAVSALVVVLSSMIYYYIIKYYGFWRSIHAGVLAIWLWALIKRAGIILQQPHAIAPTESSTFLFILTAVMGVVTLGITVAMTRILRSIYGKQFKRSAVKKQ